MRSSPDHAVPPRLVSERAVIERLHKLRMIVPAMAQERAEARREAARLRSENMRLTHRLAEIEAGKHR
jgi:hypothetical protein